MNINKLFEQDGINQIHFIKNIEKVIYFSMIPSISMFLIVFFFFFKKKKKYSK